MFAWVALGPGARGFSSPLAIFGAAVNEISGRIAFGVATLLGLLIVAFIVRDTARPGAPSED
jgi:hypothetical protein